MNDPRPPGSPEYKVYRSRRGPRLRPSGDLDALRRRLRRRRPTEPGERPGISPGRVLKWVALFVVFWLAVSLVLFLVSAQTNKGVSDQTKAALSNQGTILGGSTILVLGSDQRTGASIDESQRGPARSDTIMLLHVGLGSVRKLSIPRDAEAQIPGHGTQKINAAYALGGPPLAIKTVESFLGNDLRINHLIEIDFHNFPKFIDSLGGVTVDVEEKVCSPPFDNFWKGLTFKPGRQKLDGERALGYARVRKNSCAPNETDLDRARRQQQVLAGVRSKLVSPGTFLRLPLVSWKAPRTVRSDLRGPGLMALATDVATGGSGGTAVLEPTCLGCGVGGSLRVSEGEKADEVRKLLGK
jgi:LCP family protein required for cell wall assembly